MNYLYNSGYNEIKNDNDNMIYVTVIIVTIDQNNKDKNNVCKNTNDHYYSNTNTNILYE